MVEEDLEVEAVGGVALEESAQEVAQLGRGSARNPERDGSVILLRGCLSVSPTVPHCNGPSCILDSSDKN